MKRYFRLFGPLLTLLISSSSFGAGYLFSKTGVPYRWKTFPIVYQVANRDPTTTALIRKSFDHWEKEVTIATVSFIDGLANLGPVNQSNYSTYLQHPTNPDVFFDNPTSDTVIINDTNGLIIDAFFGTGNNKSVLGFAGAGKVDSTTMEILNGVAVINGLFASSPALIERTMTHEFGHMINLAHVQFNYEEAFSTGDMTNLPMMFPYLTSNTPTSVIHEDDAFSLSVLYPNSAPLAARGTLSGTIVLGNGNPVYGANVVCRNKADSRLQAVSWISDLNKQNDGNFVCGNLSTGEYEVFVEPVYFAIANFSPLTPYFVPEHYSGASESADSGSDPSALLGAETIAAVHVDEGAETKGVKIILNEEMRLTSGKAVTGIQGSPNVDPSVGPAYNAILPQTPYVLTVPPKATQLTMEVKATGLNGNVNLYARCDAPFPSDFVYKSFHDPLLDAVFDPLVDFSTAGTDGTKTIVLTATSTPALKFCTYYMLPLNETSGGTVAGFQITATLEGGAPSFSVTEEKLSIGSSPPAAETLMLRHTLAATDDSFFLRALTFSDAGGTDLKTVTKTRLYLDEDGDDLLTSADRLLAEGTVDLSTRKVTFSGFSETFQDGKPKSVFLTYEISASVASAGWMFWALISGAAFLPFGRRRFKWIGLACLVALLGTCGASEGYLPRVKSAKDVGVSALGYGDQFTLVTPKYPAESVKDFFDN